MSKSATVFPIVGVGASAGGIDSFKKFLGGIPQDSGMAFVLIQHLEASHESLLPEILSRNTEVPVHEIKDGMKLAPNRIFILPSNKTVSASQELTLKLEPRNSKIKNLPIDIFFVSLAENYKSWAVGVVLSGTASDGTMGLKCIKEHGGITFAERPESATWADMPQNAIDAMVVDFVLRPEEMAEKIMQLKGIYQKTAFWKNEKLPKNEEDAYRKILSLIRLQSGIDLNYYKQPTLKRRLARRMAIAQLPTLQEYLQFLRKNTNEQETLLQDMLVQVTSFFRRSHDFRGTSEEGLSENNRKIL